MPRFAHVRDLAAPALPDTCEIAVFPVGVVPFALAALEYRIPRYVWHDDSYLRGVQLIRSLQMAILCGGMDRLIESNDRIYRLLNTAIYGTSYSVVSSDPLIVEPALAPARDLTIEDDDSIIGRMELNKQLLENALNGTGTPNYDRLNGVRDLLEQIKTALEADDDLDAEQLAQLVQIVGLLA